MNKFSNLLILAFLFIAYPCFPQPGQMIDTSEINHYDEQGNKHGLWMKFYQNGKPAYKAHFEHGKPVGTVKRYFSSGDLKAKMKYENDSTVYARIFYPNNKLAAKGKFINQQKDSVWRYYDRKENTLKSLETYEDGVKNGKTLSYYDNGQKAEEIHWQHGRKHGSWKTYFRNGTLRTETVYQHGELDGFYNAYRQGGMPETTGKYESGLKTGTWKYYNQAGEVQDSIIYHKGIPENREELNQETLEQFEQYEKNRHEIEDPENMPLY